MKITVSTEILDRKAACTHAIEEFRETYGESVTVEYTPEFQIELLKTTAPCAAAGNQGAGSSPRVHLAPSEEDQTQVSGVSTAPPKTQIRSLKVTAENH